MKGSRRNLTRDERKAQIVKIVRYHASLGLVCGSMQIAKMIDLQPGTYLQRMLAELVDERKIEMTIHAWRDRGMVRDKYTYKPMSIEVMGKEVFQWSAVES